ncbi:MAG: hypothetical protein ACQEW2_18440 [Bacillota bacterium]|uniref:hypothetical protein n=1 Tax=Cytobacillus firmus TaxID=1399 RepID=UPI0036A08A4B
MQQPTANGNRRSGGIHRSSLKKSIVAKSINHMVLIKMKLLDEIKRLYYDEKMPAKASSRYSWNPSKNGD